MLVKTTCFKLSALLLALVFVLSLAACGASSGGETTSATQQATTPATGSDAQQDEKAADNKGVLVVYFSATGTTKGVAQQIAAAANADLYEIAAAQPYTSDDLNWNNSDSRTTKEQNDPTVRPSIGSDKISLDKYSTIFIGYPVWWYTIPMVLETFFDKYDLSGKTIVPFNTHAGSRDGGTYKTIQEREPNAKVLEGLAIAGSDAGADSAKASVIEWIKGLNLE